MAQPGKIRELRLGTYLLLLVALQTAETVAEFSGIGNFPRGNTQPQVETIFNAQKSRHLLDEIHFDVHSVLRDRHQRGLEDYKACKTENAADTGLSKVSTCLEALFGGSSGSSGDQQTASNVAIGSGTYGNQNPVGQGVGYNGMGQLPGQGLQGQFQQYPSQFGQQGQYPFQQGQQSQYPFQQGQQGQFQQYPYQQGQQGSFLDQQYGNPNWQYGLQGEANGGYPFGNSAANNGGYQYPGFSTMGQQGQQLTNMGQGQLSNMSQQGQFGSMGQSPYLSQLYSRLPIGQQTAALGAGTGYPSKRSVVSKSKPVYLLKSTKPVVV